MSNPVISVITVGMNHKKFISALYPSLYGEGMPAVDFEAVYVDNCSTDGSVEYLRQNFPQVRVLVNDRPRGFGENNNIGAIAAKGDYLAIINPDIVLHKKALDTAVEYLRHHEGVGMVVPKLLNPDGSHQYSVRRFITPPILLSRVKNKGSDDSQSAYTGQYLCKDLDYNNIQPVNWSLGAALVIETSFFAELGGFDTDYFLYMEDEDLCLRSWQRKRPVIYHPGAVMTHNHLRASRKIGRKSWLHLRSMMTFFRKHGFHIPDFPAVTPP